MKVLLQIYETPFIYFSFKEDLLLELVLGQLIKGYIYKLYYGSQTISCHHNLQ